VVWEVEREDGRSLYACSVLFLYSPCRNTQNDCLPILFHVSLNSEMRGGIFTRFCTHLKQGCGQDFGAVSHPLHM
jgi:hypothetical protein